MKKNLVLNYQQNFEENLTNYAYGDILAKKYNLECVYENITSKREAFEKEMKNISLDYSYISTSRAKEASKKAYIENFKNNTSHINSIKKNHSYIDLAHFALEDINYINPALIKKFKFKNLNFVKNYDILDEILTTSSIVLYISKNDIEKNLVDYEFLNKAFERLNNERSLVKANRNNAGYVNIVQMVLGLGIIIVFSVDIHSANLLGILFII